MYRGYVSLVCFYTSISLTPSKNSDDESPETSSVNVEDPQTLEGDDNCSESFVSAQGNEGMFNIHT